MAENDFVRELETQFMFHPAEGQQPLKYAAVRGQCLELAKLIAALCPDSMERSVSLERLNEVMMWANASIARRTGELHE